MSRYYSDVAPKNKKKKKSKPEQEEWQEKVCAQISDEWDKGKQYVSKYNDMQDTIYKMFKGERPEKNYDWQSNVVINKVFQTVETAVSYITQKMWGAYPVIGVDGFDDKGCWQREQLLEKWMAQDRYFLIAVHACVNLLLNGVMIMKKSWKQELVTVEQQTTEPPVMQGQAPPPPPSKKFPKEDRPDDTILNNKDVVVDWLLKPGQSIREGRFIIHREVVDLGLLHSSKAGYINMDKVEGQDYAETTESSDHASSGTDEEQQRGVSSDIYSEVEVFERQGAWPVKIDKKGKITPLFDKEEIYKKDTKWKQMIASMANKDAPVLIRWQENPYQEMTYVDGHLFIDPEKFLSMGLIEPMKDLQVAVNDNINAMFDEIWRNLMPPTIFNKFSLVEWDTIVHAPGQKWLVGGNPAESVMFAKPTTTMGDAQWKHVLLDNEIQLTTSVNPTTQGRDLSPTATQGVMNAQFSTGKLDFIIKMLECTWLVPSSRMTLRFAQLFAHPLTIVAILGEPLKFDRWVDEYKYIPCASSVKLPAQAEAEIQQDIQLMQTVASIQNPGVPKIMNYLISDILRNRNKPQLAKMFDEDYFEPGSDAGQMQQMMKQLTPGAPSNQNELPMSQQEVGVRKTMFQPRGMAQ